MPEQVIIRGSTYSTYDVNARGPMASTYEARNNIKRFNEARRDIYGGPSHIGDDPFFNFGFRQPYVWTSLNDSDFKKYIKRYDSYEFPIGSTIQDTERIGKMLVSGKGILFLAKQFLLQSQNAFNETTLYNPLSVPQAVLRRGTFGLLPMPLRHIDQGNILNSFGFGRLFNGGGAKPAPRGTMAQTNPLALPKFGRSDGAGLIRARTANAGMLRFDEKWGTSYGKRPSFFDSILSKFAPGLASLPSQRGKFRSDENSYNIMLKDISKDREASVLNSSYGVKVKKESIFKQPFFSQGNNSGIFYSKNRQRIEPFYNKQWKDKKSDTKGNGAGKTLEYDELYTQTFSSNFGVVDREVAKKYEDIPKKDGEKYKDKVKATLFTDSSRIKKIHENTLGGGGNGLGLISPTERKPIGNFVANDFSINAMNFELNTILKDNAFKFRKYKDIPESKTQQGVQSGLDPDNGYNVSGKLRLGNKNKKLEDIGLAAPKGNYKDRFSKDRVGSTDITDTKPITKNDLIIFLFEDLINQKFVQFRACLSSISQNNSADYEKFKYLGRADSIYIYKGFSRTFSFTFKVYPNNEKELEYNYNKANYLVGACQPSDYANDLYMVAPYFSLTLGKIFTDQPIILNSVNLNFEEDGGWDLDRELPTILSISVDCDILQTKRPLISNGHFGYNNSIEGIPRSAISNAVASAAVVNTEGIQA